MSEQFSRTELLIGREAIDKLKNSHVALFGVGGVGGYVAEALVRSGIGHLDLIDSDKVCLSNINRQIIATMDSVGRYKVDVMKERALLINPDIEVNTYKCFYLPENSAEFNLERYSYVIDAIDTVTAKIELIVQAEKVGTPIISSMGTGNKLNPTLLEIVDIYETSVCPLAKVMRRELRKRGIEKLQVLYSREEPIRMSNEPRVVGSTAFVPAAAGLIIASEVVKNIARISN